jgi:hypothetical protein
VIMAGNRDPEPLLPVCKSRASHFIFFSNLFFKFRAFSRGEEVDIRRIIRRRWKFRRKR